MGRSKFSFNLRMQLWRFGRLESWATRQPILKGLVHADVSSQRNRHIIIPAGEVITDRQSVALPPIVLEELIHSACCSVALNECLCRRSEHCHTFPHEVGCLFLGQAAAQINPALGRQLQAEEAAAHARQAVALGLTPMIVHSAFDAELLGIDFRRMLAVCFCCDCCCTVRRNLRHGPEAFSETVLRFPGVQVQVANACNGCGECLDACPAQAISETDGRVSISEACKGCGTCARICPQDAIRVHLDEENEAMSRLLPLVEERTSIR